MPLSSYSFLWFSCILPAIAYGSSSVNNSTYTSYTVDCQKKCSYRSRLGRPKMLSMTKQRTSENDETMSVTKWTSLKELSWQDSLLESLQFERFCVSSFCSYCKLFIFEIPASGTDFQNTGFLPAFAKLAIKYRPSRWNTGHLATLLAACLASCSALMGGCKQIVHAPCCRWYATSAAFAAKADARATAQASGDGRPGSVTNASAIWTDHP